MRFHEAARPLMMASNVFGLLPFRIEGGKDRIVYASKTYKPAESSKLMAVFVCFAVSVSMKTIFSGRYFTPPKYVTSDVEHASFQMTNMLMSYIPYVTVLLTYAGHFAHTSGMAASMNAFDGMGPAIEAIGGKVEYSRSRAFYRAAIAAMAIACVLRNCSYIATNPIMKYSAVFAIEGLVTLNSNTVFDLVVLQWNALVGLLKLHLEALYRVVKRVKYERFWLAYDFKRPLAETPADPRALISRVGLLYDELAATASRINAAYSTTLLFFVPGSFVTIITMIFLKSQSSRNNRLIFPIIDYGIRMMVCILPCILTKKSCDALIRKIHTLRFANDEDDSFEEIVHSLTLQTHHQKVSFSVFEVFPLDGSLVYGILSAFVTYTVILLQFNIQEDESDAS